MDLTQPSELRALLNRFGIEARKGLGQHFLCSKPVVEAIGQALNGISGALEIGPGPGVLTSKLCELCDRVAAIELDARMIAALGESAPCAQVSQCDALEVDLELALAQLPQPRAIVSNLPYYITGPLLTRIAAARAAYDVAALMMQKEVALRVLAPEKTSERGSLSAFLQLQFAIKKVCAVPAGSFMPPPKVDSMVLSFTPLHAGPICEREAELFELIRKAFRQPRKTLANNLISGYAIDKSDAEAWIARADLGPMARPQELSNASWLTLHERRP